MCASPTGALTSSHNDTGLDLTEPEMNGLDTHFLPIDSGVVGDLLIGKNQGTYIGPTRLAVGTVGQVLVSDGTNPIYGTTLSSGLTINGGVVFNEDSADVNFRVESNANANAMFLEGGADARLGIGTSTPGILSFGTHTYSGNVCHVFSAAQRSVFVAEGQFGGFVEWVDKGGTANQRIMQSEQDANSFVFRSLNDDGTTHENNILYMINDTGFVGIGGIPTSEFDVVGTIICDGLNVAGDLEVAGETNLISGNVSLIVGGNTSANIITNSSSKISKIGCPHYLSDSEEPIGMLFTQGGNGFNFLDIGGGSGTFNNATEVRINAAANSTTTGAALVAKFTSDGLDITGNLAMTVDNTGASAGRMSITNQRHEDADAKCQLSFFGGYTSTLSDFMGHIILRKEQTWTSTIGTRDAEMAFQTSLDGVRADKMTIGSDGLVSALFGIDVTGDCTCDTFECSGQADFTGSIVGDGSTNITSMSNGGFAGQVSANDMLTTTHSTIGTVLRLTGQASAPGSPSEGWLYHNSTSNTLNVYLSSGWHTLDMTAI